MVGRRRQATEMCHRLAIGSPTVDRWWQFAAYSHWRTDGVVLSGFLSSGDGYTRRFDAILSEFQRKERCVDDTIYYDKDLETHWWRAIDFISITG